ncbi:MAG TPA: hypothetical protein VMW76_05095 [Bacteroidales bacterium]|nr:hypothetical protein [Bacteroidales bacterium]
MTYNKKELERLSSAFTLSDMEIFIFPELFWPLILANIMSPVIWSWRNDPWFKDIEKKNLIARVNRVKQYIIQNYVFNLDLETWGLTSKNAELSRFGEFFDTSILRHSNALFGYEGDKYYFDIDIRKHFGLDKYNSDIIPYWKTETVEAMEAFRHKKGFSSGAGECVSLSALFAAALFLIAKIPLERIFLIATPLHSQNFITAGEGILTNNRRIVTKNMWYNGTSLSTKARRALENEKVTIVSHLTGYIHINYQKATINKTDYQKFLSCLNEYLNTSLSAEVLINFLRFKSVYKKLFQYQAGNQSKKIYISLEKMFEYEHSSRYNITNESRSSLIKEIDGDEFSISPLEGKILLNDVEEYLSRSKGVSYNSVRKGLSKIFSGQSNHLADQMFDDIVSFISIKPRLPGIDKEFLKVKYPEPACTDTREDILHKISDLKNESETAMLALYVFRDMNSIDWYPFIKASIERNPVSVKDLSSLTEDQIYKAVSHIENVSIYDENRLALPDETWNFGRGDGVEKALLMATVLKDKGKHHSMTITIDNSKVHLTYNGRSFHFRSRKSFRKEIRIENGDYFIRAISG